VQLSPAVMELETFAPHPELAPHVRAIWSLRDGRPAPPVPQMVAPDACIELVLNFADPVERLDPPGRQPRFLFVGEISRAVRIRFTGRLDLLGIRFAPGAAWPFVSAAMEGVVDRSLPLDDLVSADFRRALSSISGIGVLRERVARVEEALRACLRRRRPPSSSDVVGAALRRIERGGGRMSIERLATSLGISSRQLERRFWAHAGATPKLFARVFRFQQVLRTVATDPPDWAAVAATCGYFDQAHLIRDFKRIMGATPRDYLGAEHPLSDLFLQG